MLRRNERNLDNIPAGTLGIIAIDGCQAMGKEVDHFITTWRMKMDTNSWMNVYSVDIREILIS